MIVIALILTFAINIEIDLGALLRRAQAPQLRCGIKTVMYSINGRPRQQFKYANERFEIPEEGFVELIADPRHTTIEFEKRRISLENQPLGPFSIRYFTLPAPGEEK